MLSEAKHLLRPRPLALLRANVLFNTRQLALALVEVVQVEALDEVSMTPALSSTVSSTKIGTFTRTASAIASLGRESISIEPPFTSSTMRA